MKTVAFIPLRRGSQSIPLKNIKVIAGKPLAAWCLEAAQQSSVIDEIVISTDSSAIKEALKPYLKENAIFHDRAPHTATDTATTESALLEYFEKSPCDHIVLIQATSPLTSGEDLSAAMEYFTNNKCDSLVSVARQHKFYWEISPDNGARPVNYDFWHRPRRQDFQGSLVENGAFYIFTRDHLLATKNRLGGKIGMYEMSPDTLTEVDEPNDWVAVENLLIHAKLSRLHNFQNVKLVITDIDGVWTDGGMYYSEAGDELKKFHTRDGMGVQRLRKRMIEVAIVTAENTCMVSRRAEKLGVKHLYQGVTNKAEAVQDIQGKLSLTSLETVYIGDDINDLSVRPFVVAFVSPADGMPEIKRIADWVCHHKGGEGCFRELADLILASAECGRDGIH